MKPAATIGAFFDLDGTLLPQPSLEWRFVTYLLAREEINSANVLRWFWHCSKGFFREPHSRMDSNKFYLAGLRESLVSEWARSRAGQSIEFLQGGLEHLSWHLGKERQVVLASGTLAPLARAIARQLPGNVGVIATELEVRAGHWTGQLAGEHVSGREKARAVAEFASWHGLKLDESYAYGDRISDLPMLESVGHPIAVNPGARLERAARLRGWPICDWRALSPPTTSAQARCLSLRGAA